MYILQLKKDKRHFIEVYVGVLIPLSLLGFRRTVVAGENWLKITEGKQTNSISLFIISHLFFLSSL